MSTTSGQTGTVGKIEKIWKLTGIIIGALGLMSAIANWAFTYAMLDRDTRALEMMETIRALDASVVRIEERARTDRVRAEEDMRDVQMALRILEVRAEYERRTSHAAGSAPVTSPAASRTRVSNRAVLAHAPGTPDDLSAVLGRIQQRHPETFDINGEERHDEN
jgi:hypothetical protein